MNLGCLPNLISALRILLVLPVLVLLWHGHFAGALMLFAVAGASDAVDGYLARRFGWSSALGGWLDPIADKTMMVSTYLMLAWLGLIPLWLLAAVVARDAVIATGSMLYYHLVEKVEAEPSWISKANTVLQILLVMAVMFDQVIAVPQDSIRVLTYAVLGTVVLSGLGYVVTWGRRALRFKRNTA